jgi:glutathione S-transferase
VRLEPFFVINGFLYARSRQDDGFILYESRAICRYLAEKYAEQGTVGLIPPELRAKALFEQAASIEYANFQPYAWVIYVEGLSKAYVHPSLPSLS